MPFPVRPSSFQDVGVHVVAMQATQSPCVTSEGPRVASRRPPRGATTATGSRSGRSRKWICPTGWPAATLVAQVDEVLVDARLGGEAVVFAVEGLDPARRRQAQALPRLLLALEHPEMDQHVPQAALRQAMDARRDGLAAAHLGRDDDLALASRPRRAGGPPPATSVYRNAKSRVPGERPLEHLPALLEVGDQVHVGARDRSRRSGRRCGCR